VYDVWIGSWVQDFFGLSAVVMELESAIFPDLPNSFPECHFVHSCYASFPCHLVFPFSVRYFTLAGVFFLCPPDFIKHSKMDLFLL